MCVVFFWKKGVYKIGKYCKQVKIYMYKMVIYRDICFILVKWYIDRYVGCIG